MLMTSCGDGACWWPTSESHIIWPHGLVRDLQVPRGGGGRIPLPLSISQDPSTDYISLYRTSENSLRKAPITVLGHPISVCSCPSLKSPPYGVTSRSLGGRGLRRLMADSLQATVIPAVVKFLEELPVRHHNVCIGTGRWKTNSVHNFMYTITSSLIWKLFLCILVITVNTVCYV